jgi:LysM repeat protein
MTENTNQPVQEPDDTPEYLKFLGLLVVILVAILALAVLSPRLIGQATPKVLGLGGAPAAQPEQVLEEAPTAEPDDLAQPETAVEPEGAAAPGEIAPDAGMGGMEVEVQGIQHEVLPGQTLYQVAELYGVSVAEIAAANHLVNPMQLQPGSILIIPLPQ